MIMINKKILHIINDYAGTDVYRELISNLSLDKCIQQRVVSLVRSDCEVSYPKPEGLNIQFFIDKQLKSYHRLFFRTKIKKIFKFIEEKKLLVDITLVHAHMLYSDGAVALKIYQKYDIPYIVAIRDTDVNYFMRFRPDLSAIRNKIIANSKALIFICPAHLDKLLDYMPAKFHFEIRAKSHIIGNGIPLFWHQKSPASFREKIDVLRVIYVGNFSKNKNIRGLLKAVEKISKFRKIHLSIVGGTESEALKAGLVIPFSLDVTFHGRVISKDKLIRILRDNDIFAMPSFTETFGLAYAEALSQGLPILHSFGQGLDGYFPQNTVSEAVIPNSYESIAAGIINLENRLLTIRSECISQARQFNWPEISLHYIKMYKLLHLNFRNPLTKK
jgi:glycosyltransferase involved in cell wall biosynthesis